MGRHSRRGPAPKGDDADIARQGRKKAPRNGEPGAPGPTVPRPADGPPARGVPRLPDGTPVRGTPRFADGTPAHGMPRTADATPAQGVPRLPDGPPARGVPRLPDGTPVRGTPRFADGTPAHGMPRTADGAPAQGVPRLPDGTPARGVPRFADGTPARGVPRFPDGTPARGVPRFPDGTPAQGVPRVRGGHPQQREAGGGWGEVGGPAAGSGLAGVSIPRQRQGAPGAPRQDYVDAFDEDVDVFARRPGIGAQRTETYPQVPDPQTSALPSDSGDSDGDGGGTPAVGVPAQPKGGKGRAFTGVAAAAVTTVLAVIVAGQVADGRDGGATRTESAAGDTRATDGPASRGNSRTTPSASPRVATLSYEQAMDTKYPLSAKLAGSGKFDTVPGADKAPGKGRKYTYRVDVEQGLGLDGELFAQAVQKTLNDDRSWAHDGARTFERVSSGKPDFVITLASPGTTAKWCAKSGLDTTEDNVSCDSASTERVMINAYRWAQGSKTYGDKIYAYRQMLINHEVGHRLGYGHVTCDKDGELAPVMQQQTKFLDHDGIHCLPNSWPYPKG
ncbi:DUF3152 domain-containing protein [Streptomyces sp. NPDC004237]|uniref:DUF3152 domain-containing protein n=1 Tax=Streptomyces sp. NPDC004237 TaxID=3154455 RepID=UPI0033BD81F5